MCLLTYYYTIKILYHIKIYTTTLVIHFNIIFIKIKTSYLFFESKKKEYNIVILIIKIKINNVNSVDKYI